MRQIAGELASISCVWVLRGFWCLGGDKNQIWPAPDASTLVIPLNIRSWHKAALRSPFCTLERTDIRGAMRFASAHCSVVEPLSRLLRFEEIRFWPPLSVPWCRTIRANMLWFHAVEIEPYAMGKSPDMTTRWLSWIMLMISLRGPSRQRESA